MGASSPLRRLPRVKQPLVCPQRTVQTTVRQASLRGAGARRSTTGGSPKRCSFKRPPRRFWAVRIALRRGNGSRLSGDTHVPARGCAAKRLSLGLSPLRHGSPEPSFEGNPRPRDPDGRTCPALRPFGRPVLVRTVDPDASPMVPPDDGPTEAPLPPAWSVSVPDTPPPGRDAWSLRQVLGVCVDSP